MENISAKMYCNLDFDIPVLIKEFDNFVNFSQNIKGRNIIFRFFSDLHNKIRVVNTSEIHITYTNNEYFK